MLQDHEFVAHSLPLIGMTGRVGALGRRRTTRFNRPPVADGPAVELARGQRPLESVRVHSDLGSDEQLWALARAGDTAAFAAVFDRHLEAVYTQCVRRSGSWVDAEDLASMVFLEAWRKAGNVRFVDGSLRPWLLVVATNITRTQARARRRYEAMLSRLPHEDLTADAAEEVISDLDAEQSAALLARAMATLGKAHQEILALCDLAELSYAEAAAVLAVPVGTVRSRLSRARRKLRGALDSLQGGESVADQLFVAARPDGGTR
jgi:RNA polymerase sigma-70 factor (ECF subfamily)